MKKKKLFKGKNFDVSSYEFSISGKKVQHEIIEQNSAAAILAIEKNKIIMIRQFRYPHKQVLEIPAGIRKKNETSLNCAKRELLEETGYKSDNLLYLGIGRLMINRTNSIQHLFVAKDAMKVSNPKEKNIKVIKITQNKLFDLITKDKFVQLSGQGLILKYLIHNKKI